MNKSSKDRLAKVHPELATRITRTAATLAARGTTIEVVQGLRTYAEQDALYAQGRTKPGKKVTNARGGQSNHNFGLAVDVCPFVGGKPNWDAPPATWERIGEAGEAEGLEWGGNWSSIVDMPHLQLPGMSVATCRKLYEAGGLPKVWAAVKLPETELNGFVEEVPPEAPEPAPEALAEPTQQTVEGGGAGTQVVVGGTTSDSAQVAAIAAVEAHKDAPPVQASQGGFRSLWATITTALTAIPTAIWGLLQGNSEIIKWALIVGGAVVCLYLTRSIIVDVVRMLSAARPDRHNVK